MSKRVICYIQAYDCAESVEAAMRSVLEQTYENWICFVLSNGNKNTSAAPNWTFDIIKNFAAKDRRFIVLNKRENNISMYIPMLYHLGSHFPNSYICSLDADDEYERDFFERGVAFAEAFDLDVVACGTQLVLKENVEAEDGVLLRRREIEENRVIQKDSFAQAFPFYKPFFNEMWGKLYRAELLGNGQDYRYAERHFFRRFLPDTRFTIDILSKSEAIGILSGTSHIFYQFSQRKATNATTMINSTVIMQGTRSWKQYSIYDTYEIVMSFLRAHGKISEELNDYMHAVLFGWFGDFYQRTLLYAQNEAYFVQQTEHLVFHPRFDEVMRYPGGHSYDNLRHYEQRIEFCKQLHSTVLGQKVIRNRKLLLIDGIRCSNTTRRRLERVAAKLEDTVQALLKMQREEG